jgi:SLT domain-containing protein/phage-related tail protein
MAGKIPAGEFNTRVTLDANQPMQSLRELKSEVSSATSAWKAQRAELKMAGDELGAAKAKYEGITSALNKQKEVLKAQKSSLQNLEKAQSQVDRSTKNGQAEYERYSVQIARAQRNIEGATTKVARLSQQQDKAKNSLTYYKSGLASAQNELRKISESSNAYINRLEAEGKHEEANKARLSGLSREYNKLNEVYKIQQNELSRIASEAGKSSDAYRKQKVRVDETATSLAKTKTEMSGVSSEMKKANPSIFDRIKAKITGVNNEAKHTHSLFSQIFSANLLSNIATSAWGHLTSAISSAKDEAKEYSLQQETMLATWHTLTGSAKEGQKLVDMTTKMAVAANNSVHMVDELNQKFYAISKNPVLTGKLTKSVLTLQDAFGATDDAVENFGVQFAQMMANGKVSAQDMMSFVNVFPVLRTNLLKTERSITHNSKMTMAQMNDLMSAGKISSATMEKVLQQTAKQYQGATENFGKTIPGMIRTVKSQMPVLLSSISTPLTKAANPIVAKVSDWVTSKETKSAFGRLGKTFSDGLNKAINSMSSAGGKNSGEGVTKALNKGLKTANELVKKFFDFIADHGKDLGGIVIDITKLTAEVGKQVWKDFADIIGTIGEAFGLVSDKAAKSNDPLAKLRDVIHNLAQNKTAVKLIAGYLVTMSTIRTLGPLVTGLSGIAKGAKGAYGYLKGMPDAFENMQIKGLLAVDKVKDAVGKLATTTKGLFNQTGAGKFSGMLQSARSAGGFNNLTTVGKIGTVAAGAGVAIDAGSSIISAVKDKKGSMKQYQDAGKGIGSAIGSGIGLWFGGPMGAAIGSQIGKAAGGWGGKAVKEFQKGWNAKKPPKKFWSLENLGWSTKDTFSKIGKAWDGYQKQQQARQKKLQKQNAAQTKAQQKEAEKRKKNWDKYWKNVGKGWNDYWKNTSKSYQKGSKNLSKNLQSFTKKAKKSWSKHWSDSAKTVRSWADKTRKNYTKGIKYLEKSFKSYTKNAQKNWSSHWSKLRKDVANFWTKSQKETNKGSKKLLKALKKYHSQSKDKWKDHFDDVKDSFQNFSKRLRDNHGNFFKTLQQEGSKSLDDIRKSWADHWSDIRKNTADAYEKIRKNSNDWGSKMNSWFGKFGAGWKKGWQNLGSAVGKIWSDAWSTMQKIAKGGINKLIGFLNGGIGAVNSVIHFFGGGKSTFGKVAYLATGTGYSTGTRRPITKPTLAIVNDGFDSPETGNKESWYRPDTGEFGIFQGRNTPTLLAPGTEVFNASETRDLLHGVGFEHYAGGTGFISDVGKFFGGIGAWIGGATDKLKKWFDTAENVIKNPMKYLNGIFHTGNWGLDHGAILDIGKAGFNKAKNQVSNFWKTLWQMVSGQLDGGGAEGGLLGAVEKYGKGHPYVWGAAGPDAFDCSGLVMYALKHAFGVSFPHYSGAQFSRTVAVSNPQPGDLVFFGPGGSEHVGVYAGNGKYYSAMSPSAGIGMSAVSSGPGQVSYRRVPGLKGEGGSTSVKAKPGLESFVKKTVGSGFWSFISKLSDLFGIGAEVSNPSGAGVARWEQTVIKALKKNGFSATPFQVSAWMKVIQRESGGDPHAINTWDSNARAGHPSKGLVQTIQPTFNAYAFPGHRDIWNGYDNLLAGINYMKHKYGSSSAAFSRVAAYGYANGGLATVPSIFGEAGPEMAIPLSAAKSSRTYELIGKTAAMAAARDGVDSDNQASSKLMKKIDDLTDQLQILVAVLSQQSDIKVELTMDKRKMGQALVAPINKMLAKQYAARRMRFSG